MILFIVGAPGIGKTTLVRELLGDATLWTYNNKPKWTFVPGKVCAAGHYKGGKFDGADTIPYNGARDALVYWAEAGLNQLPLTIFDGDRFSDSVSLEWLKWSVGISQAIGCIHLRADNELLAQRRALRGSTQNPTWMKGRETKAANFAEKFGSRLMLPAKLSMGHQVEYVNQFNKDCRNTIGNV